MPRPPGLILATYSSIPLTETCHAPSLRSLLAAAMGRSILGHMHRAHFLAVVFFGISAAALAGREAQAGTSPCAPDNVADWLAAGRELLMQCQAGEPQAAAAAVLALEGPCACDQSDACVTLAAALQWCPTCERGNQRAMALYAQACLKHNPVACLNLGMSLEAESRRAHDAAMLAEARKLYEAACAANEVEGCAFAGAMLLPIPDKTGVAVGMLNRACEGGEAGACRRLMEAYALETPGVPKDGAAAGWARKRACMAGVESACDRGTEARATDE